MAKKCKMRGCDGQGKLIRGFCEKHYKRFKRGQIDENGKQLKPLMHTGEKRYKKCKIRGCEGKPGVNGYYIRGFCALHYSRFKAGIIDEKGKVIRNLKINMNDKCKIKKCNGKPDKKGCYRKGFCYKHYMQYYKGRIDEDGYILVEASE